MNLRIWIHEARGNESGCNAWSLEFLGFATHAASESLALQRTREKFREHCEWLGRHGLPSSRSIGETEVVERMAGDEVLFTPDREPATRADLGTALSLLACSRSDLVDTLEVLPEETLDWDPPYEHFETWASWRTIRQILAHIANTETRYYLPRIGHESQLPSARPEGDWRRFLAGHRAETVAFLEHLRGAKDLVRLRDRLDDQWSLRKVLRRLVRHELLHWKSICRIAREFTAQKAGG